MAAVRGIRHRACPVPRRTLRQRRGRSRARPASRHCFCCSGLREIVVPGETGVLVAADDPGAIADAVCAMAADWPAAREMAERAHVDALNRFGTKRYADDLMRLLVDAGVVPA